jgi:hypothetical protein
LSVASAADTTSYGDAPADVAHRATNDDTFSS